MEESELDVLKSGDVDKSRLIILKFNEKNVQTFKFPELNNGDKRKTLWSTLFQVLENPDAGILHKDCLASVRILSRDKNQLDAVVTPEMVSCLLRHAGLVSREEALNRINEPVVDYEVMLEAVKCLCNLTFNSSAVQHICSENHSVESIILRLRTYRDSTLPDEIKYFDMKMLFIITALCPKVRLPLKEEYHGFIYLMETIGALLKQNGDGDSYGAASLHGSSSMVLTDDEISLLCEILKVLYNITIPPISSQPNTSGKVEPIDEDEPQYTRLVSILHDLLLCQAHSEPKRFEFVSHTVNLLTNMPSEALKVLITPSRSKSKPEKDDFEGYNMAAFSVVVDFLSKRIEADNGVKEVSTPVLSCLVKCARNHRIMRRFLKNYVLPPLTEKDSRIRPEEGANLRGFFCRQMTSVDSRVADLVADLVFVLCKENAGRMIKYVGYGNAAGLFAKRGLMGGRKSGSATIYSSDSDSDTEEYKQFRDLVNPVTGCIEPPHVNPLEGMSEEQKEYEALKLANLMSKLTESGVIKPAHIGVDGRPEAVQHVLQLQEEILKGKDMTRTGSDSESD